MAKFEVVTIGTSTDIEKLDEFEVKMKQMIDRVDAIVVNDDESLQTASEYLSGLSAIIEVVEAISERFRKPAYDHYKIVLAEKKKLLDPPKQTIQDLRLKMSAYIEEREKREREAEERAVEEQRQKIVQEAEQAFNEAAAQNDSNAAEEALDRLDHPEHYIVRPTASETPQNGLQGATTRTTWAAELVAPEDESMRALCSAIGKGKAPADLVTLNTSLANKLARRLRDSFSYPGLRAKSTTSVVRSRNA